MPEKEHGQTIICRCSRFRTLPAEAIKKVVDGLIAAGAKFEIVDDLCGLAARADKKGNPLAGMNIRAIIGCAPRATRWLMHRAGIELSAGAKLFDLQGDAPHTVVAAIVGMLAGKKKPVRKSAAKSPPSKSLDLAFVRDKWKPWFPVIDYSLCVNCKQCMGFCLFGVYAIGGDGKVCVRRPTNCKTNCPACARVCPRGAIIFPKYEHAPINGRSATQSKGDVAKVDLDKLAGGDVYKMLRDRAKAGEIPPAVRKMIAAKKSARAKSQGSPAGKSAAKKSLSPKLRNSSPQKSPTRRKGRGK